MWFPQASVPWLLGWLYISSRRSAIATSRRNSCNPGGRSARLAAGSTFFPPNTTSPDANQYGPGESNGYCDPNPPNPPCVRNSGAYPTIQSARSRHAGGVNTVFCDGSVHFINNGINLQTWRNLGSSGDGQVLGEY